MKFLDKYKDAILEYYEVNEVGSKFSAASNEYWNGLESKKVSDECKIANYELREDFKQYIDDYFNKFYEQ